MSNQLLKYRYKRHAFNAGCFCVTCQTTAIVSRMVPVQHYSDARKTSYWFKVSETGKPAPYIPFLEDN